MLARTRLLYDWDWASVETEFRRAIELNPNSSDAYQGYASYLALMGKHDESIIEAKRALDLDPLSIFGIFRRAHCYHLARQYDKAIEEYKSVLDLDPNYGPARIWLAIGYSDKGMYDEALLVIQDYMKQAPEYITERPNLDLARVYALSGNTAEAKEILKETIKLSSRRYVSPARIAMVYAILGQHDQAFELLESAFEEKDHWMVFIKIASELDNLRSDQRFKALLKKMNFPE